MKVINNTRPNKFTQLYDSLMSNQPQSRPKMARKPGFGVKTEAVVRVRVGFEVEVEVNVDVERRDDRDWGP